jgi:hypothetical protein
MSQTTPRRKTLRDFNFESCDHPEGSVAYDQQPQHCIFCGARRTSTDTWEGGSIDYRMDLLAIRYFGKQLEKNIATDPLPS